MLCLPPGMAPISAPIQLADSGTAGPRAAAVWRAIHGDRQNDMSNQMTQAVPAPSRGALAAKAKPSKAKPASFNFSNWWKRPLTQAQRLALALALTAVGVTGCVAYPVEAGPAYYYPGPYYYYGPHYYYGPYHYYGRHGCYRCW